MAAVGALHGDFEQHLFGIQQQFVALHFVAREDVFGVVARWGIEDIYPVIPGKIWVEGQAKYAIFRLVALAGGVGQVFGADRNVSNDSAFAHCRVEEFDFTLALNVEDFFVG